MGSTGIGNLKLSSEKNKRRIETLKALLSEDSELFMYLIKKVVHGLRNAQHEESLREGKWYEKLEGSPSDENIPEEFVHIIDSLSEKVDVNGAKNEEDLHKALDGLHQ